MRFRVVEYDSISTRSHQAGSQSNEHSGLVRASNSFVLLLVVACDLNRTEAHLYEKTDKFDCFLSLNEVDDIISTVYMYE